MGRYAELERHLIDQGIDPGCVRINETPSEATFCILNQGEEIEVFFFERGQKYDLRKFTNDEEAIAHFTSVVLSNTFLYKSLTERKP